MYPQTFYGKMRVSLFRQEVRPVICCISDIHGELDKLEQMLELIRFSGEDHLYILGGVIVRGTLGGDIFWRIIAATNMTMLLGNHKQMCLRTLEPNNEFGARDLWRMNGGFVCLPGADLSPDAPRAEWDPVFPRRPAGLSGPDSGWAEVSSGTRVSGRGARNPHLGPGGARQQKPLSGHHLHCRPHAHGVPYGWARRGLFNLAWRRHPRHRLRLWQHEGGTPTPGLPAAGRYGRVLCGRSGRRHLLICRASRICGRPFSFLVQLTIPSSSFHPDATHPHDHPACGPERYASPGVSAGASGRCADQCWIEAGSSPQSSGSCGRAGG